MTRLIANLPPGARVLDDGAGSGSFAGRRSDVAIVRVDLEPPGVGGAPRQAGDWVAADAARLPFGDSSFDLVVSNHSLEHFPQPEVAVSEMGRVLKPGGALYIAVPDATTVTDRIYRWLGKGGGHVNPFRTASEVVELVKRCARVEHAGTRELGSGLSFLNAHNFHARPPRKIALFAFGNERFLAVLLWLLRRIDRTFGTRLTVYGWAFYFGSAEPPEELAMLPNVCVRCGAAHSADYLRAHASAWRKALGIESYRCPACVGFNLLSPGRKGAE